jgi:glutamyl-Q tRNA(Asp) synthetase
MVEINASGDGGMVTRFAPSPTGYLHLGHAYSALLNFERARVAGGRFLLRIEDIDSERCRPEFEAAIYEDLAWFGLTWDRLILRQSTRLALYEKRLVELRERGLVYRCFRSRQDITSAMSAPHGMPTNAFRGTALPPEEERALLADGRSFAWRLSLDAAEAELGHAAFVALTFTEEMLGGVVESPAEAWRFGDVILGRKDNGTSYHLASVLDDAETGVTHVIRGDDLREVAGLHAMLHALFGLRPPLYRHHRLLVDDEGRRLSKRNKSETLRAVREAGVTAEALHARLMEVHFT